MPSFSKRPLAAAAALLVAGLGLAGCMENHTYFTNTLDDYFDRRETVSRGAGDAVFGNAVVQTYDPWPLASANRNLSTNGEVVEAGIQRYRSGRVFAPRGNSTSSAGYAQGAPQPSSPSGGTPTP